MQIIPDTNFLIYAVKYKLFDYLLEYDFIIIEQVITELKKLTNDKKTKLKDRQAASVALEFLKSHNLKIVKQEGKTDDAIIEVAKKLKVPIATMDKEMTNKAKKFKIKIMKIRQKKYLGA